MLIFLTLQAGHIIGQRILHRPMSNAIVRQLAPPPPPQGQTQTFLFYLLSPNLLLTSLHLPETEYNKEIWDGIVTVKILVFYLTIFNLESP